MRVFNYGDNIQKIDKAYLKQSRPTGQKQKTSESSKSKKTDEIILSPRIAEIRKYEEIAKSVSEIREEKANSIRSQIESSSYRVGGRSVARSMKNLLG